MKKLILYIMVILAAAPVRGVGIVERADSLYNAGSYEAAVKEYSKAIDSLGRSSDLYYNLGNAWYRTGHPGRAIVAYERALRINPRNAQARANLDFVNTRIVDRTGERGTVLEQAIDAMLDWMTPNGWAWTAFGLFVLTLGAVALYCFTTPVTLRKVGFFGAIILFVVTSFTIFLAVKAAARATASDIAVVVEPSTILSTSPRAPRNRSEEAMLLHEGTKMKILDSLRIPAADSVPSLWLDVEVDNTHRAWINAAAVERL